MALSISFSSPIFYGVLFVHMLAVGVTGQAHGVNFTYPTAGLTVYYLDTLKVSWTSNFSSPKLFTFCKAAGNDKLYSKGYVDVPPYNGSYLAVLNYDQAESCYFNLRPNMTAGYGANSFSVRVVTQGRSSTTLGVDLPSSTPTSVTSSDPAGISVPADDSSNPGDSNNNGLSTGAKAGIGIGAAAGAIGVAALAAFFLMRWRKKRGAAIPSIDEMSLEQKDNWSGQGGGRLSPGADYMAYKYGSPGQEPQQQQPHEQQQPRVSELPSYEGSNAIETVHELGGESRPLEAPGSGVIVR